MKKTTEESIINKKLGEALIEKEPLEDLNLSSDFLFKKVMQNPVVCTAVLEAILGKDIVGEIRKPDIQKQIMMTSNAKSVYFDVFTENGEGTTFDLEIQKKLDKALDRRMLYYETAIVSTLLKQGKDYANIKDIYVIFICDHKPYKESDNNRYNFQNIDEDNHISANDGTKRIVLSTTSKCKNIDENLLGFLKYIHCSKDTILKKYHSPLAQLVANEVKIVKNSEKTRSDYMTYLVNREDALTEGIEIGEKRGIKKGEEKERMKNKKEQLARGRRALMKGTLDIEEISELTGLTMAELEKLQEEIAATID